MLKTFFLNSDLANYGEEEFNYIQKFLLEQGILNTEGANYNDFADLKVSQHSTGDMTVDVAKGVAVIETIRNSVTFKVFVANQAIANLAVTNNTSGSNRVDAVILKLSRTVEPNALMSNVSSLEVVAGDGVSALSDEDIQTAIGAGYDFIRLANITVANGATQILTADIADTRVRCYNTDVTVPNPTIIKFRQLSADPTTPVEGEMWYNTTDNLLRYFDGANTINIQASTYTGGNGITVSAGVVSVNPNDETIFVNPDKHYIKCDILIVAGGGGAGKGTSSTGYSAGGGGGGGLIFKENYLIERKLYKIIVGLGGIGGGPNDSKTLALQGNGANSSAFGFEALGGGYGGSTAGNGNNGGSGGGAGINTTAPKSGGMATQPSYYSIGYGNNGANSLSNNRGGGGGGAGSAGQTSPTSDGIGLGGDGMEIFGTIYSKGGNGGSSDGANGGANTGNGGNAVHSDAKGGNGGSGIVVIRYLTDDYTDLTITGGTITVVGDYTYHTFTTSGDFSIEEPIADPYSVIRVGYGGKVPTDLIDNTTLPYKVFPADVLMCVSSGTVNHSNTSYTKVKEIKYNDYDGIAKISFGFKTGNGGTAYGRIYVNGVAVGTEQTTTNENGLVYFSENISIKQGDLIQLYTRINSPTSGVTAGELSLNYALGFYPIIKSEPLS